MFRWIARSAGLIVGAAILSAAGDSADKAAFEKVCGACHPTSMVDGFRSEPDWRETVDHMVEIGAKGSAEEFQSVIRFLLRFFTKVNVNTATAREIAPVLDVGDALSEAIVQFRMQHGNFRTLEDLRKVPGLATVNLEDRKDRIVF